VLPAGVVCDGCNNYFAVKVEGPLLKTGSLRQLRARQGVPTKRGRLMPVLGRFEDIDADLAAFRINAGEVVLAAGAVNTPKLLELSGIGDGARCRPWASKPSATCPAWARTCRTICRSGRSIGSAACRR